MFGPEADAGTLQENGQKGVDDLAAHIREEADPPHGDNIPREIPEDPLFSLPTRDDSCKVSKKF